MTATAFIAKQATSNTLYQQDFISTKDITLGTIELVLQLAQQFKKKQFVANLQDKVIASCFFEPSTRTRLSFEAAAHRLGAKVVGFASDDSLSTKKGETLSDTVRMLSSYADLIVMRHPAEGSARLAAEVADCPVINAGDGANQHPTQAMTDIFTINECQKDLRGLSIALVGDLKHGRTVHSLLDVCALFDMRIYLVAPEMFQLPDNLCDRLKQRGMRFSFHQTMDEVINKVDVLYMTRIQQERFSATKQGTVNPYVLTQALLKQAKSNLKILHPLPRMNEIPTDIDNTPFAYYFQQAANGVFVRQALLHLILSESLS